MLLEYIRLKILRVDNRQSFFLKIRNQIRRTSDNLGELFKRYAEEDGFLYIEIKKESIFWSTYFLIAQNSLINRL